MIPPHDSDVADVASVSRSFFERTRTEPQDDDAPRYDRALWRRACEELGVAAILESPADGGLGGTYAMMAAVLVEAGRVVSPLPLLGSVVLGQALMRSAKVPWLTKQLLDGSVTVAVALDPNISRRDEADEVRVSGQVDAVLDGASADLLVLVLDGRLLLARTDDEGLTRSLRASTDLSRHFAQVTFDSVAVEDFGAVEEDARVLHGHLLRFALACEQVGGAERCLELIVEHLRDRIQFGRPLGTFQALKHQCADLAVQVDEARSALAHLVWALDESPDDVPGAAALAAVVCSDTHLAAGEAVIHLHGGMGFTWEHSAHRHFRRAVTNRSGFLDLRLERDRMLTAFGI